MKNKIYYRFLSEKDKYSIGFDTTEMSIGDIKKLIEKRRNMQKAPDKYDLIFIDAAKAQYTKFFEKFAPLLNDNGVIISDNIELLDLQRLTDSKKSKRLVAKMGEYKQYLINLNNYKTEFLDIGDGFAITRKIN